MSIMLLAILIFSALATVFMFAGLVVDSWIHGDPEESFFDRAVYFVKTENVFKQTYLFVKEWIEDYYDPNNRKRSCPKWAAFVIGVSMLVQA